MYKRYSEYKNSGIEWLGEIPSHWNVIRTRFVFDVVSGNGFSDDLQGRQEGEYPFYKCSDINSSNVFADKANNYVNRSDVEENNWSIIPRNSILLAKIGEALKKNHRKINTNDCLIDNNMMAVVLRGASKNPKYYYYLMSMIRMEWFVNPGAVPSIDVSKFRSFLIPRITKDEQENIEKFLDRKIVQVDDLIAQKKQMIELLKEERAAIINQAVTKVLNLKVEMKDSGIDWLGKVPKHWEIKKLKFNALVQFSNVNKKSEEGEIAVRLCNYVDVYYNDFITPDLNFMEATASTEEIKKFHLKIGDVLLTKDSEEWNDIAIPAYVAFEASDVICGYHLAQVRPQEKLIQGKYLFWFLLADCVNHQFRIEASGVTRYGLSNYALSNSVCLIPSKKEQGAIAAFLDQKTVQIDEQVAREQKSIELLQEYRTALISEVVTGKIDVGHGKRF